MSATRDVNVGVEASAKLLQQAIEYDKQSNYQQALVCYQEGIQFLMDVLKGCQEPERRKHIRNKIDEYLDRAEKIKIIVNRQKTAGKYHEQIKIEENATGYSYAEVFGAYLDDAVTEVTVEDAYIRSYHQINNFLRFCELLVLRCKNLQKVYLTTTKDNNPVQQEENLSIIKASLSSRNITLLISYSTTLHDREIRLSSGWIIKVGRGLDYFKRPDKLSLGFHESSLRKCLATTIDIFHEKYTRDR